MLKDSLRTHGMAGIVEMSSQLELRIQVPMYSFGSECYSALDGRHFQTKIQGRSKKDKGDDQEWEIFPDDGYEETWFPDVSLLCITIARNDGQGRTYCTCSQDDLEPCGEMKGAPDFMRRV
jgi:hypothetical protein